MDGGGRSEADGALGERGVVAVKPGALSEFQTLAATQLLSAPRWGWADRAWLEQLQKRMRMSKNACRYSIKIRIEKNINEMKGNIT